MITTSPLADRVRSVFAHYPSGVAAIAAHVDGADQVMVASSFTVGVSLDPALVMFAVQRTSTTWPLLRRAASIGISVLAADHSLLCRQLAGKDRSTRWTGVVAERRVDGAILIDGSAATFESRLHAEYPAGDHEIVVLEVTALSAHTHIDPLLFHGSRFRSIA